MAVPISLGDLIRAAAGLDPRDDAARSALLRMLGFDAEPAAVPLPALDVWLPSSTAAADRPEPPRDLPQAADQPAPRPDLAPTSNRIGLERRTTISRRAFGAAGRAAPDWIETTTPSPADKTPSYPPPEPLFGRRTQRAILGALAETYVEEGDLDLDRLIDTVSERRVVERLPRAVVPTLRGGLQLLVDRAAGMDPYRADQMALIGQFAAVLAEDRFTVVDFSTCPTRPGRGLRARRDAYRLPPRGTPILIVSDLGIGGPPLEVTDSEGEWIAFARVARQQGYSVVALVPYQARRWPPRLARAMTLVHWSERTTVRAVRKTLRRAAIRL